MPPNSSCLSSHFLALPPPDTHTWFFPLPHPPRVQLQNIFYFPFPGRSVLLKDVFGWKSNGRKHQNNIYNLKANVASSVTILMKLYRSSTAFLPHSIPLSQLFLGTFSLETHRHCWPGNQTSNCHSLSFSIFSISRLHLQHCTKWHVVSFFSFLPFPRVFTDPQGRFIFLSSCGPSYPAPSHLLANTNSFLPVLNTWKQILPGILAGTEKQPLPGKP